MLSMPENARPYLDPLLPIFESATDIYRASYIKNQITTKLNFIA